MKTIENYIAFLNEKAEENFIDRHACEYIATLLSQYTNVFQAIDMLETQLQKLYEKRKNEIAETYTLTASFIHIIEWIKMKFYVDTIVDFAKLVFSNGHIVLVNEQPKLFHAQIKIRTEDEAYQLRLVQQILQEDFYV